MWYDIYGVRITPLSEKSSYTPVAEDENKSSDDSNDLDVEYQSLQKQARTMKRWLIVLGCLLGVSIVVLLLSFANTVVCVSKTTAASSHLTPVPEMPMTTVTFDMDDRYAGPSTGDRDRAWGSLMPVGQGFVVVNDSQKYNLQPGKNTSFGELYDISMFHQLHCLTQIRSYLFTLQIAMNRNNTQEIFDIILAPKEPHVFHCLDYLRQGVMCVGDMTIEWPREESDGRRFAVDGWGVQHQCKSWVSETSHNLSFVTDMHQDAIMNYMETHRSPGALR